jgi:hypothetical protein
MEDAGKKATSLDRIYKDAAEHVGQVFMPAYNKQIEVLSYLGNLVGNLSPTFMKLMAITALTITTFVALTGIVYGLAKAYDALASAAARAGVTMPAAGALMGLLQKMPGQLALIGFALAGVTAAYALWYKSAGEVRKEMIETRNQTQQQVETINSLQKQMAEIKTLQASMGDAQGRGATFTKQELALYQNVNEETAKGLIMAERRADLAARQKQALEDAAGIDATLITILKSKSAEGDKQAISEQALLDYKKRIQELDSAALKDLQGQRTLLQEQQRTQQKKLQNAMLEYYTNWVGGISTLGFRPGVYCPFQYVATLLGRSRAPAFWVVNGSQFRSGLKNKYQDPFPAPEPLLTTTPVASAWQLALDVTATVGNRDTAPWDFDSCSYRDPSSIP